MADRIRVTSLIVVPVPLDLIPGRIALIISPVAAAVLPRRRVSTSANVLTAGNRLMTFPPRDPVQRDDHILVQPAPLDVLGGDEVGILLQLPHQFLARHLGPPVRAAVFAVQRRDDGPEP